MKIRDTKIAKSTEALVLLNESIRMLIKAQIIIQENYGLTKFPAHLVQELESLRDKLQNSLSETLNPSEPLLKKGIINVDR